MSDDRKPIPRRIVVFGASGRIGGPLARYIGRQAPAIGLRVVTSRPDQLPALRAEFPKAEIVVANYLDAPTMTAALAGSEGVFLVTPNFLDERAAMEIFADAVRKAGSVAHIVRILGDPPGMTLDRHRRGRRANPALTEPSSHRTVLSRRQRPRCHALLCRRGRHERGARHEDHA